MVWSESSTQRTSAHENVTKRCIGTEDRLTVFFQTKPGASAVTLLSRVRYGGRKGRSAYRRLARIPHATVQTAFAMNGVLYAGAPK
jgi:hypothetical protein